MRVRFADLRSVTRSVTLDILISTTRSLAEIAEALVRGVLSDHFHERFISLLAIAVSHLETCWDLRSNCRPRCPRNGAAPEPGEDWLGPSRSLPDALRELAKKKPRSEKCD